MDKYLVIIIAAIALGVAFILLQPPAVTAPDVDDVGDASCVLPQGFCQGEELVFYRCSNGSAIEIRFNCSTLASMRGVGWCNPLQLITRDGEQATRANCDIRQPLETDQEQETTPDSGAEERGIQSAPPLAYCGNGVVDFDETCNSCPGDFACSSEEYCEEISGLCKKINEFGDETCTELEEATGSDCLSCGCPNDQLCSFVSKACQGTVPLTTYLQSKIDDILNDTLTTGDEYLGLVDTIYENQSAKMLVIDCNPENVFFCRTFVVIDRDGNVLEVVHST